MRKTPLSGVIRVIGEPTDFIGIQVERDRPAGTITIHQADKALALAAAAGVQGVEALPMNPAVFTQLRAAVDGEAMADVSEYRSWIGSLLHLAGGTRPDIQLAVNALASYGSAPSAAHRAALLHLITYVGCTAERGITYGRSAEPLQVFCDANFATCLDTRRSITGYAVIMYGGAVSWASKKQPTVAVSTMEAEYVACAAVTKECSSIKKGLPELGLLCSDFRDFGPFVIGCDNQAALSLCKDRKDGQRVKHIDITHHYARDSVARGDVRFRYCRSADNFSDCLTKAVTRPVLAVCLVGLGMSE